LPARTRSRRVKAREAAPDPNALLAIREQELGQYADTVQLLQERLAELELALEDTGWLRVTFGYEREFTREGLRKIIRLARLSFLKNPLINHGVRVQADYVWGQGANIQAKTPSVNDVIQAFLDDRRNSQVLTGHMARLVNEMELQVHGNIFLALFTDASSGFVRVRSIHTDEILDIVCNPEDSKEPWYYKRQWTVYNFDPASGSSVGDPSVAFYPDWTYNPRSKPRTIDGVPVNWDTPIYHVKAGGFSDMRYGVPEIYSALDWARAVKEDLEDYATLRRALARFAWNLTLKGGGPKGVAATKTKLSTTVGQNQGSATEVNPPATKGSTFISTDGAALEPIKTAGAQPSPEEGARLWLMAAAGMGLPETILAGNADVGNYATAKSLDRPTELKMRNRQTMWADIFADLLNYVIDQAALRPNGPLQGKLVMDRFSGESRVALAPDETGEETDRTIEISFPEILERDVLSRVQAIVQGATLNAPGIPAGTMSPRTTSKLLFDALGVGEVDELLEELFPDNGDMAAATPGLAPAPAPTGPKPGDPAYPTPSGDSQPQDTPTQEALRMLREVLTRIHERAAAA
jgi:hypothetical protein